jgi:hypothetical protein
MLTQKGGSVMYKAIAKILKLMLFLVIQLIFAQQTQEPAFFGAGPSSKKLAARQQTPGATGFQDRHYPFEQVSQK